MTSSRHPVTGPAEAPSLGDGLPHIGAVLRRVRHARELRQLDVVNASGLSAATVARLEAWGRCTSASFEAYLGALQDAPGSLALRPEQADFLRQLRVHDHALADREALSEAVSAVAAGDPGAQPGLRDLLAALAAEARPAMLVDPLLYMLAVNRSLIELLELTDGDDSLRRWSLWHVVGNKLDPRSPYRQHLPNDDYLASLLREFLLRTCAFLFTRRFQRLLADLHLLAPGTFAPLWHQASSLSIPDGRGRHVRVIARDGRQYVHVAEVAATRDLELCPGQTVTYSLAVLTPTEPAAPVAGPAADARGSRVVLARRYLAEDGPR